MEHLKVKGYRMAVLSVSPQDRFDEKYSIIAQSGIAPYFEKVLVSVKKEEEEIDAINSIWNLPYKDIAIVGDRVVREVAIANKLGMVSIWVKRGIFANEFPTPETGGPTFIISTISELKSIL